MADGHDAAHAHGSTWLFGVISFQTVVAALTFFGLCRTGIVISESELARFHFLLPSQPARPRCTAYITSCNRCTVCGMMALRTSIAR